MLKKPSPKALSQPILQFADVGHKFVKIRIVPVHHRVAHLKLRQIPTNLFQESATILSINHRIAEDALRNTDYFTGIAKPCQSLTHILIFSNIKDVLGKKYFSFFPAFDTHFHLSCIAIHLFKYYLVPNIL